MRNIILAIILLVFVNVAYAIAPPPEYLAINNQTKECGVFYGAMGYNLADGWESYGDGYRIKIKTPYGDCVSGNESYYEYYKTCCESLGFKFVYNNVSQVRDNTTVGYPIQEEDVPLEYMWRNQTITVFLFIAAILIALGIFVYRNRVKNKLRKK